MTKVLSNKRGSLLIMTYYVISSLVIIGAAFVVLVVNDQRTSQHHLIHQKALMIAESGYETALYHLRSDFNSSMSFWDGDIHGISAGPDDENFYPILEDVVWNDGTYTVNIKNVSGSDREMWVQSTGIYRDKAVVLTALVQMYNPSPWAQTIFIGQGSAGYGIKGDLDIYGSLHILGTGLTDTDKAISFSQGVIKNNYQNLTLGFMSKILSLPQTDYNNQTVDSMFTNIWVKNGLIELNGTSQLGESDNSGNTNKETLDGVYQDDGITGSRLSSVYADALNKGYGALSITFPLLSDPYLTYSHFTDYFADNALVISDGADLAVLANLLPTTVFSKSNAFGTFTCDGAGQLTISGLVYINGGGLKFNKDGASNAFIYSGKGVILATSDIEINANLGVNTNVSFPSTKALGLMTSGSVSFNEADIEVSALIYAGNEIVFNQKANVAGTLVANYIDAKTTHSVVVGIPKSIYHLPSGLIDRDPDWHVRVISWQESS